MKFEKENLVSYILSASFSTVLLVYFLKLPYYITGYKDIVNEYYGQNFGSSIPLDLFYITIYFAVSMYFMKVFKAKNFAERLLTVVITTAVLTSGFCYYFNNSPKTDSFFSRWFNTVKYSSAVYDVILLGFIYYLYEFLLKYSDSKTII